MSKSIKVGISHGDINGISYEIILKALSDNRLYDKKTIIVYGSPKIAAYHKKHIKGCQITWNQIQDASAALEKKANILTVCDPNIRVEVGKSTEEAGTAAFQALEHACADLKEGKIDVLVTAPINKHNIHSENFKFPGHTEYLAQQFGVDENLMFLMSENLRVGVATGHIPLKDVSGAITEDLLLKKLRLMSESLIKDFSLVKPKIAVLGLNPHAGDNGIIGDEEINVIIPAINKANEEGMIVHGPFPADGFFGSSDYQKFDAILAMYHDQGLTAFKSLAFEGSVNYTAGMPYVRTSPGHGTAYNLAGKDKASRSAMLNAIFTACDVFKSRSLYSDITKSPLEKAEISDNMIPQNNFDQRRQNNENKPNS